MSSKHPNHETPPQEASRPVERTRREFLGSAVAVAAAVATPALLGACDAAATTAPQGERVGAPGAATFDHKSGGQPWWTLHHKIKATIGSATDVKVPTLEKTTSGYLQRIITDTDRTGTGLATIVRNYYKFADGSTLTVQVQTSGGKKWPARGIYSKSDLILATKDALATNTIYDGVLQESELDGNPVVVINKASVVQFWDSVTSDYYGNHLQVASHTFVDLLYSSVGGYKLTATTRDYSRS